ncbi:MAG: glycoside hydrolase family 130 protein [Verrucomicrobia bacterium]|nr:glycoside hydrolase family 130 protein [Verrucomicrobiota bacterium]
MRLQRTATRLMPDRARVLIRPFQPASEPRVRNILRRTLALSEADAHILLERVLAEFGERHPQIRRLFSARFDEVRRFLPTSPPLSEARQLLIGSYFIQEYALESAALFNPSIVPHPDQSALASGALRFILSLRATGEGHISSITFRTGEIAPDHSISLRSPTRYVTEPQRIPNPAYEKSLFTCKLQELGLGSEFTARVFGALADTFTLEQLRQALGATLAQSNLEFSETDRATRGILMLALSNYEVEFSPEQGISERVIFPSSPSQSNGIEDARFVLFEHPDGRRTYYATYTAFDGRIVLPQLLETADFLRFKFITLNGPAVHNKGMALFPRPINGRYVMLARQDNENIFLMDSDNIHFWHSAKLLISPMYPWEFVQMGNCGSPIETEAGWLVLSHGVGPMRKYCIGAFLLDRDDPTHVIGRLREPLLAPTETEREGYVPNVVYTCGALLHDHELIIPYAMADFATGFATVPVNDVLGAMH